MDVNYHNQGYMTEALSMITLWAFHHPKLTYIVAETLTDNIASNRVLEKCGYQKVKHLSTHEPIKWRIPNPNTLSKQKSIRHRQVAMTKL
jgi:RimJ/RimL family protein N-acetyltransferase